MTKARYMGRPAKSLSVATLRRWIERLQMQLKDAHHTEEALRDKIRRLEVDNRRLKGLVEELEA